MLVYYVNNQGLVYMKQNIKLLKKLLLLSLLYSVNSKALEPKINLVTEHLPPYQIVGNDSYDVTGFATEIVLETLKRSGIKYTLTGYPWVRSYNLALQKPNTCIFSIARIPLRENLFTWIGQITEKNNAVVWGLKSNPHAQKINKFNDLKNYVTAVNKNDITHLGMIANGFSEGEHLYVLKHTKSLLKILFKRPEIDFIIADDITISYRAKLANVDVKQLQRAYEIKVLPLDFYLACNKQSDPAMIHTLQNKLNDIHRDGTYAKILAQWKSKMPHLK